MDDRGETMEALPAKAMPKLEAAYLTYVEIKAGLLICLMLVHWYISMKK